MSEFIPPLQLETWVVNVFAGSQDIFLAIALVAIFGMVGYFRMSTLALFFMVGLFFAMFSSWVNVEIYFLIIAVGSLLIGYWLKALVKG